MSSDAPKIVRGTAAFRRTNLALFAAGLSTFALLYCVQPLMPLFVEAFHVDAVDSSLTLSLTTGMLAFSMLVTGVLSDMYGRRPLMISSLFAGALLVMISAYLPNWTGFLVVRALLGVAISGVPAIAMAYISEEMHHKSTGIAMGIYIGGSAIGGMTGRLLTAVLADYSDWRTALCLISVFGLCCALVFWQSLPRSRHFNKRVFKFKKWYADLCNIVEDKAIPLLFAEGFLLLGCFVTIYNYIGFRLLAAPFNLSQTSVGLIFCIYIVGVFSSAMMGDLAGRVGRRRVLWSAIIIALIGVMLTISDNLVMIMLGIAGVTFGFFGGHSIVSSWVGNRTKATKAQAASLYLFFYYLGSSIVGSLGGVAFTRAGWDGVCYLTAALLSVAFLIAIRLIFVKPLPDAEADRSATQIVP